MRKSTVSELQLDLGVERKQESGQTSVALPCDKWIASSALQKAIRRGEVEIAQRAALTLQDSLPNQRSQQRLQLSVRQFMAAGERFGRHGAGTSMNRDVDDGGDG